MASQENKTAERSGDAGARQDGAHPEGAHPEGAPHGGAQGGETDHFEVATIDRRKLAVGAVVAVVILLVAFFARWIPDRIHQHNLAKEAAAAADAPPVVDVVRPEPLASDEDLTLYATVSPMQQTSIYARVDGYLKQWRYDINAHVKQRDLLAEIDAPDTDAQLNEAKAALEQAKANVVSAKTTSDYASATYDRYHGLLATGGVTQQDLDQRQSSASSAVASKAAADAAVKSAEATVQRLSAQQNFERIIAPFDGTITYRAYDVGARISANDTGAGRQLFDIAQTDKLRVWVYIPQSYVTLLRLGEPVSLEVPRNYPGQRFNGVVARSAGVLDPNTRTLMTELDFDNADGRLWAGMYATVHINVHRGRPALTIPTPAMLFEPDGTLVVVVDKDRVHLRKIKVGQDLGQKLEVLSGLKGDELIVANPGEKLTEGAQVELASAPPPISPALASVIAASGAGSGAPATRPARVAGADAAAASDGSDSETAAQ